MDPLFSKYPTPDLSGKPVGSTREKKSRNQWLVPSLPPPCFELAAFTRTTEVSSWPISSFCSCFTISFKHCRQMLTNTQVKSAVDAQVHQTGSPGPSDDALPATPSFQLFFKHPSASLLGAIASAFSIAGILFLQIPDGLLFYCLCLSLIFSMKSSHFKVLFINHPPLISTNRHL